MNIEAELINQMLIEEDIEGLIALGAPHDEYETEALIIADAVSQLNREHFTETNIFDLIVTAWGTFELSPSELKLRYPSIKKVARIILDKKKT